MSVDTMPLLRCGCRAQSLGLKAGEDESLRRPACVVHECFDVAENTPDLSTRRARCTYYGKSTHKNECNYGQDRAASCTCEQPSSGPLPFFRFLGEGSPTSIARCTCGFYLNAHYPFWQATLNVDREWYKVGRTVRGQSHQEHAKDEDDAMRVMERRADFFRSMGPHDTPFTGTDARVYGVTVTDIKRIPSRMKCKTFTPCGPAPFDEFYCGCHGWD